jgi:hypothetical protein
MATRIRSIRIFGIEPSDFGNVFHFVPSPVAKTTRTQHVASVAAVLMCAHKLETHNPDGSNSLNSFNKAVVKKAKIITVLQ